MDRREGKVTRGPLALLPVAPSPNVRCFLDNTDILKLDFACATEEDALEQFLAWVLRNRPQDVIYLVTEGPDAPSKRLVTEVWVGSILSERAERVKRNRLVAVIPQGRRLGA